MAFSEPVLTKRIPLDPSQRKTYWYDDYVASGGYAALNKARTMTPDEISKVVTDSGLRGRGGAGFSAGQKWSFIPKEKKVPHYLAVNADESEPGTFKDRMLLNYDPHQLLEGIAIAARATQCDVAYIYIRGEYHLQAKILERAIAEAYDKGIFGTTKILDAEHKLDCYVHKGAGAYICGEETGLLESLEGKRGWPRNKPPFPAIAGAFARPTVINNVETLCCVPSIIERGPEWFKTMGTKSSPGPKLFGMSGHVNRPGVYEQELGITLDFAINELAGGMKGGKFKGCICGGISMGVLGPHQLDIKLDFDDVRFRGGCLGLGTAGMIVMNEHTDMVAALRNCVRFYARESCGQCTPCREGAAWMKKILDRIMDGGGRITDLEMLMELEKTMGIMPGTTICGLADGTAWATRTFINKYYDEFAARCTDSSATAAPGTVPLTITRGRRNVLTPMGSNTRESYKGGMNSQVPVGVFAAVENKSWGRECMAAEPMPTLPYSNDLAFRRSHWRRRLRLLILLAIVATTGWWVVTRTMPRVSLTYWQRQCAKFDYPGTVWNDKITTISSQEREDDYTFTAQTEVHTYYDLKPRCYIRFLDALYDAGCPFPLSQWDESGELVFLHERTSPGGLRRIICAQLFEPFPDRYSTGLCCAVITPATATSPPAISFSQARLPGWCDGVEMDRLKLARPDPTDSSHFVLEYDHEPPNASTFRAPNGLTSDGIRPFGDMSHGRHYIVDGWLRDDGTVRFHLHTPDPNWP